VGVHIGKRTLVDYGMGAGWIPQIRMGLTAAAMWGPWYLVVLARCYHEHLHAARPAELMLSDIHRPRAHGSRDRRRHPHRQASEMLPHCSLRLSASNRGRAKELPFAENHRERRYLGLRIQKAIEVALCQREVQKELSQRVPLDTR